MNRNLASFIFLIGISSLAQADLPTGARIAESLGAVDNPDSPFFIDPATYTGNTPESVQQLPIGVFDSGTGGLTVLEAILGYDGFDNDSGRAVADGIPDFRYESFEYLGDLANMPYGNYPAEGRADFLEELSVKDALFLIGDSYYESNHSVMRLEKRPVKTVVIACNTATAYGKTVIEQAIDRIGTDVTVIGVVDAGARGTLNTLGQTDDGTIGVMATVGTVASNGYPRAIRQALETNGYSGQVDIVQQGGIGIAEAIDNDPDYINRGRTNSDLRNDYAGPSILNDRFPINPQRLQMYNFVETNGELLTERSTEGWKDIQINSVRNYVRYHVTELLLKMVERQAKPPLRSIVLGCTHYPYVEDEISSHLSYLAAFENSSGEQPFKMLLGGPVSLVDPAKLTAHETFLSLKRQNSLRPFGGSSVNFYISTPNMNLPGVQANAQRRFEYDYKYGRLPFYASDSVGLPPEYVLRVPMKWETLDEEIVQQIRDRLPRTYSAMESFNDSLNPDITITPVIGMGSQE